MLLHYARCLEIENFFLRLQSLVDKGTLTDTQQHVSTIWNMQRELHDMLQVGTVRAHAERALQLSESLLQRIC